ncbi:MAG: hypothetical protein AB1696_03975 [Planctomycetota bacterium]
MGAKESVDRTVSEKDVPKAKGEKDESKGVADGAKREEVEAGRVAVSNKEVSETDAAALKGEGKSDWLKELSLSANSTFNTKYVWRGLAVEDAPVWQPDFTVGYGPVSFNWWGNMDMTRWGDRAGYGRQKGEFTEIDYNVDVSVPVSIFTLSGGYVAYTFPHTGADSTTELYTGVSVDCFLKPALKVYFDVDECQGEYGLLCFKHDVELFKIGKDITVGAEACISGGLGSREFNDFYYGVRKGAMVDLQIDGGLPISFGDHITVTPGIHWSKVVNPALREGPTRDDTGWLGIRTGISF